MADWAEWWMLLAYLGGGLSGAYLGWELSKLVDRSDAWIKRVIWRKTRD
jgi:hypothetical protein